MSNSRESSIQGTPRASTEEGTSHRPSLRARFNKVKQELRCERAARQFLERCLTELASGSHVVADEEGKEMSLEMQVRKLRLELFQERAARRRDSLQWEKRLLKEMGTAFLADAKSSSSVGSNTTGSLEEHVDAKECKYDRVVPNDGLVARNGATTIHTVVCGPGSKNSPEHVLDCDSTINQVALSRAKGLLAALWDKELAFAAKNNVISALHDALNVDLQKQEDLMKELDSLQTKIATMGACEDLTISDDDDDYDSSDMAFERKIEDFQYQVNIITEKIREARNETNIVHLLIRSLRGGVSDSEDHLFCAQESDADRKVGTAVHAEVVDNFGRSQNEKRIAFDRSSGRADMRFGDKQLARQSVDPDMVDSATSEEHGFNHSSVISASAAVQGVAQPCDVAGPVGTIPDSSVVYSRSSPYHGSATERKSVEERGPLAKRFKRSGMA